MDGKFLCVVRGGARRLVDLVGRQRALLLLAGGEALEARGEFQRQVGADAGLPDSNYSSCSLMAWGLADRIVWGSTSQGFDGTHTVFEEALDLLR